MRFSAPWFSMVAPAVLAVLAGCINTDTAVFVAPTLSTPALALTKNAFGTGISSGSFSLDLHLGARASGPSTVSLVSISVLDAQMKGPVVPSLPATPSKTFPVTVQQDSDVNVDFTVTTGTMLLPAAEGMALCAAAGVVLGVTIQDSLLGATPTTAYSPVFHPTGCM